jgi:short-subunit dehydrogenase
MSVRREAALITGASSGIGRELAKVFAKNDHDVVLVARREAALRELADELSETYDIEATVIPKDLSKPEAPQELFNAVHDAGLDINILVNNAGVATTQFFADAALDDVMNIFRVNAGSVTALSHLFLRPMLERREGRILNVASVLSFIPTPSTAIYGATKAFVLSLSEALSEELRGTGITVTALCPGYTQTEMISSAFQETGYADFESYVPGFVKMTAEQVAREGYRACMAGRAVLIPGLPNQLGMQWIRYQPRWLVRGVGGMMARLRK